MSIGVFHGADFSIIESEVVTWGMKTCVVSEPGKGVCHTKKKKKGRIGNTSNRDRLDT